MDEQLPAVLPDPVAVQHPAQAGALPGADHLYCLSGAGTLQGETVWCR